MKVQTTEHMYDDLQYEQDVFDKSFEMEDFDPFEDDNDYWSVGIKDNIDPETIKMLSKF